MVRILSLIALASCALAASCESRPPLQLESTAYKIFAADLGYAEALAADMEEYEPKVQALLGVEKEVQHILVVARTSLTSEGSHGATSASGEMEFGLSAVTHPTDSIVPHELVHAHFELSGLPKIPTFIEEGIAYRVGDLVMRRDTAANWANAQTDYTGLTESDLDRFSDTFRALEASVVHEATKLGYEIVYTIGIQEALRLGREGAGAMEYVRRAGLGIGDDAPPPRNQDKPIQVRIHIGPASSHP